MWPAADSILVHSANLLTINTPQFNGGVLRAKWSEASADTRHNASYEEVLACALQEGSCRFWLLDISERECSGPDFGLWLAQEFAVRASGLLNGPLFGAYLVTDKHLPAIESAFDAAVRQLAAENNFYIFFFENAALALDWLRDQQEMEPIGEKFFKLAPAPGKFVRSLPTP